MVPSTALHVTVDVDPFVTVAVNGICCPPFTFSAKDGETEIVTKRGDTVTVAVELTAPIVCDCA